jgi:hypothetical protein
VLWGFEATTMQALLFQSSEEAFHHAILHRAIWGDELWRTTLTAQKTRDTR